MNSEMLERVVRENFCDFPTPLQQITYPLFEEKNLRVFIKRDDLIHPAISGNKWRKLKYNLREALAGNFKQLLTFGGAHSNHIAAVAAVGNILGLKTVGVIRGNWQRELSPTLQFAQSQRMTLHGISADSYRCKTEPAFIESLHNKFGAFYLIPEGGSNQFALTGCEEIVQELSAQYAGEIDYIVTAVGTGATLAGLASASSGHIIGVPVLKNGTSLMFDVRRLLSDRKPAIDINNWTLMHDYHFGGYARVSPVLVEFMKCFMQRSKIILDPVYSGKAMYALVDMAEQNQIPPGAAVVFLHTGGLQGIPAMIARYPELSAAYDNLLQ